MAKYGYVYILTHDYMDEVIKVGCTERSPHERADELSKGTAIPSPFNVLCYIEVENFQTVEQKFHEWMAPFRISSSREFFYQCTEYAIKLLYHYPHKVSFVVPSKSNLDLHLEGALESLPNPYKRQEQQSEEPANEEREAA